MKYIDGYLMLDLAKISKETEDFILNYYKFKDIKDESIRKLIESNDSYNIEIAIEILKVEHECKWCRMED